MANFIKTANHEIHLVSCRVTFNGKNLKIRTKTFLLLKLLIESSGQIVSKDKILNEIWSDVITDDQVIFQSIKELRKIFEGIDVIKNYPRKGYAWVPEVSYEVTNPENFESTEKRLARTSPFKNTKYLALIFSLAFCIIAFLFFIKQQENTNQGSIIILPVMNELSNIDHQWVRLGVMDQIIHQLPSSNISGVLQTDDVLEIMSRANVSKFDFKRKDIDRIFSVSGATLIVELRLSGNQNEYQLIYSLHRRNGLERGVIIGENITVIANQLAMLVSKKANLNMLDEELQYHSDFANEMLATALDKINAEEFNSAKALLNAAKEIEPSNLVISRHLARVLVIKNQLKEAEVIITEAISTAEKQKKIRELGRLYTLLSQIFMRSESYIQAIDALVIAEINAKEANDWLYLGYISSIRGKAYQQTEKYLLADKSFKLSINYHKVIQCPFGQAQGLLALAELAISQGNYQSAQKRVESSLSIIKERKLTNLQAVALSIKSVIKQKK
ncbi:MAG: winged helix-turn-helix domain-containing protein [Colwellia sp.]|nr:winged helix-turn-helix domain-containing protein [Colwellia sp.]